MIEKKHKLLFISDHPLSTSGVGTQARYLINGLIQTGKYQVYCYGAAIKHENYDQINVTPDWIIKPIDGFGNREMIRLTLAQEQPDAVVLFTDPRFFLSHFEMEDEIHQVCPIAYWTIWDNGPWPEFNRVLYDSCDLLNCINYNTYDMISKNCAYRADSVNWVPHGVPAELFTRLSDEDILNNKRNLIKRKDDTFIALWVNRNARRKMPGDVLYSWKLFVEEVQKKYGHKNVALIMHTDPLDQEGPNLHHMVDVLKINDTVIFSKDRCDFPQMNVLYNISDCVISRSCAEGFGLSLLEGAMTGTPSVALKTGGMEYQVVDYRDGSENGIAIPVELRNLVGSQTVPYIWDDQCTNETFAAGIMKMYELGPEGRKAKGEKSMQYSKEVYSIEKMVSTWDRSLEKCIAEFKAGRPRWTIKKM